MPRTKKAAAKPASHKVAPDRLFKVGQRRVATAIRAVELCGSLSTYQPSQDQVQAIESALTSALERSLVKLRGEPMFILPPSPPSPQPSAR